MTKQKDDRRKTRRISNKQARFLSNEAILEERGPSRLAFLMIFLILALIGSSVAWANFVPVVTSAKTEGEVIPFGKNRVVQHLEGGIIQQISVSDGDLVKAGQILVRFEPTLRVAELDQVRAREATLQIRARRIKAFIDGTEPAFDDLGERFSNLVDEALFLLRSARERVEGETAVLKSRTKQRKKTVDIFTQQANSLRKQVKLVQEAVDMRI